MLKFNSRNVFQTGRKSLGPSNKHFQTSSRQIFHQQFNASSLGAEVPDDVNLPVQIRDLYEDPDCIHDALI